MRDGPRKQHLSDEEFSDLLAGEFPDDDTRIHLASCEYCRNELDCVRDTMSSFSGFGTRWANTVAPDRVPVASRWAFRLSAIPSWTTGLAMTALTGILVFSFGPVGHARTHSLSAARVVVSPTNNQLADDNRLMVSIEQELAYQDESAVSIRVHGPASNSGHAGSVAVIN